MDYKLTVIIPVYNRAQKIGRALESVFRQSLENIEIIAVDDGSSDNSVEVVKEYQKTNSNIKLFAVNHGGPGLARNIGIKHANGEYIIFLDSDDWIPENAYETMYSTAKLRDADIVIGQYLRKVNGSKWTPSKSVKELLEVFQMDNCAGNYIIPVKNPSCCNKMVRTELLKRNGICFTNSCMAEDLLYSVTLFDHANTVYILDEVVYMYETNTINHSIVSTPSPEILISGFEALKKIGLKFHDLGQVEVQDQNLIHSFEYIFSRFRQLPAGLEKNLVFEKLKEYLGLYKGLKEYQITIENLMGMELDIVLKLPYPTYVRQRTVLQKRLSPGGAPIAKEIAHIDDPVNVVLNMYKNGQVGLRYIAKYFLAWLHYKLMQIKVEVDRRKNA